MSKTLSQVKRELRNERDLRNSHAKKIRVLNNQINELNETIQEQKEKIGFLKSRNENLTVLKDRDLESIGKWKSKCEEMQYQINDQKTLLDTAKYVTDKLEKEIEDKERTIRSLIQSEHRKIELICGCEKYKNTDLMVSVISLSGKKYVYSNHVDDIADYFSMNKCYDKELQERKLTQKDEEIEMLKNTIEYFIKREVERLNFEHKMILEEE